VRELEAAMTLLILRHFLSALRYDLRVEAPAEVLAGLRVR
jgi:hypothetical protein